ncbi:hypothetical protein K1J15_14990, partial [Enterobacter roggenkampii]|nr:hypothetical protein [Enterobacter roggenkampii]
LMMSLWDALRMNMMISYQELVRTFLSTATVNVIATKTQGNKSIGGTVKQEVVNNAPKKIEGDTVTTEFKK